MYNNKINWDQNLVTVTSTPKFSVYNRNIFGPSSEAFVNLRLSSAIFRKCCKKMFLWQVFGQLLFSSDEESFLTLKGKFCFSAWPCTVISSMSLMQIFFCRSVTLCKTRSRNWKKCSKQKKNACRKRRRKSVQMKMLSMPNTWLKSL